MSRLAIIRDKAFRNHITPGDHPESPRRLEAIDEALDSSALSTRAVYLSPRPAEAEEIAITHSPSYVERLESSARRAISENSLIALDGDTYMSPKTFETAKLAAGAGLVAAEALKEKSLDSVFIAVRPPGHHALRNRAMGFCLFNNIALAASYARKTLGAEKVMIIDWDVHHGNGTQDLFYDDPHTLFLSLHQHPFWPPGSGRLDEEGEGDGKGFNINIPLPEGTGDRGYFAAFDRIVKPVCHEFSPDLIMLSAGFDAHMLDPLADQQITTLGFAMLSQRIADMRDAIGARLIAFLEGGYNTSSLAESALATMEVLEAADARQSASIHAKLSMPEAIFEKPVVSSDRYPDQVDELLSKAGKQLSRYWHNLK